MDANANEKASISSAASNAYIYYLPTELLDLIMRFLFALHPESMIAVRRVCRWFRRIADLHEYWQTGFDFRNILPAPRSKDRSTQLIHLLLGDEHLRDCLSRKTEWEFFEVHDFLAALISMPTIIGITEQIIFKNIYHGQSEVLFRLRAFDRLTRLTFHTRGEPFNLDLIAIVCPVLEFLDISVQARQPVVHGSLRSVKTLKNLRFKVCELAGGRADLPFLEPFLPVNSANILTHLSINLYCKNKIETGGDPLGQFVNLIDLQIYNYSRRFEELVATANISLKFLYIRFGPPVSASTSTRSWFLRMFSALSLKNLTHLKINLGRSQFKVTEPLIEAITHLNFIEQLEFKNFKFRREWISYLAHMRSLLRLSASIDKEQFQEVDGSGQGRLDADGLKQAIQNDFISVFTPRFARPRIAVDLDLERVWFDCRP
jgi:hypothetical protein